MKKITLTYFLFAGLGIYITISGYSAGPGTAGLDCTGAETGLGNPTGCIPCHGSAATDSINIAIELDSTGGVPTTHYTGGKNYTVKLTGTNNSTFTLPNFGFQMGALIGSTATSTTVIASGTNAGTWNSPYPTQTHYSAPSANNFVVGVVEHSTRLNPITGTGGNGTKYSESFSWTAPTAGTGTISIWAALNAVNANGTNDTGDKWNTNHVVINEWTSGASVASLSESAELNAYPNPVSNNLNLELKNIPSANYSLSVFDISGRKIIYQIIALSSASQTENISALNWKQGVYIIFLEKDNFQKYISVVKE